MRFEWDENKNRKNRHKHGIDFREAVYAFSDPCALGMPDEEHSEEEDRWVLLGKNLRQMIIVVIHTERESDVIRIISARKATGNEQALYRARART